MIDEEDGQYWCYSFDIEGDCSDCGKPRYKGGICRRYAYLDGATNENVTQASS